jgi:preprotein translocase subunit SecG
MMIEMLVLFLLICLVAVVLVYLQERRPKKAH